MNDIAIGTVAGIAANESQKHLDKHLHGETDHETLIGHIHNAIRELHEDIKLIAKFYEKSSQSPIDETLSLTSNDTVLHTKGRNYNMILVPNYTTIINVKHPRLGVFSFTPALGWTELNFPDGTILYLSSGTQNIVFRCSNFPVGNTL